MLENEFGDSPLFVLKDPRACRLLDFWIDAFADFEADAHIAVPVRNPLEVAASLKERDTIDPSVGLLLWLRHVLDVEAASREHRRAFVRFEALLDNWQPLADAMGDAFDLTWPRRSTSAGLEIEAISYRPPGTTFETTGACLAAPTSRGGWRDVRDRRSLDARRCAGVGLGQARRCEVGIRRGRGGLRARGRHRHEGRPEKSGSGTGAEEPERRGGRSRRTDRLAQPAPSPTGTKTSAI